MSKKTAYPTVGTWAQFEAIAQVARHDQDDHKDRRRVVKRTILSEPAIGQFVGVTYLYEGRKVPGGYEDPGYLADRRGVLVYEVRLGLRANPVHVLPSDFKAVDGAGDWRMPFLAPAIPYLLNPGYGKVRKPYVGSAVFGEPDKVAAGHVKDRGDA